jgi:DNA-binding response OmpR family regulator
MHGLLALGSLVLITHPTARVALRHSAVLSSNLQPPTSVCSNHVAERSPLMMCLQPPPPSPPAPSVPAAATTNEATSDGAGPLLVLVDDQAGMRSAVQKYLAQSGFRCSAYPSAEAALHAMAGAPPPDAVVTDVVMPGGMDGLAFVRTLRAHPQLCAVPVVLLTAKGLTPDRIAGYAAGCSAYIPKPFDPEELVAVLRSLTANTALHRSALLGTEVSALRADMSQVKQVRRSHQYLALIIREQDVGSRPRERHPVCPSTMLSACWALPRFSQPFAAAAWNAAASSGPASAVS